LRRELQARPLWVELWAELPREFLQQVEQISFPTEPSLTESPSRPRERRVDPPAAWVHLATAEKEAIWVRPAWLYQVSFVRFQARSAQTYGAD
jgi:hypothetical protein